MVHYWRWKSFPPKPDDLEPLKLESPIGETVKKNSIDEMAVNLDDPENLEEIERLVQQIKSATDLYYSTKTPCGWLVVPKGETEH